MQSQINFLLVGNFDSSTGYAWHLMESLWCQIYDDHTTGQNEFYVVFPTVSQISAALKSRRFTVDQVNFNTSDIRTVARQLFYLRKRKIRVVYFTDQPFFSFRYALFRLMGVQCIITHDHTPGVRSTPSRFKQILKRFLNSFPGFTSDAVLAVSPYVAKRLVSVTCAPRKKVYCVSNGIDVKPQSKSTYDFDETASIVTVARANYYKGIDFALRVVSRVQKQSSLRITYTLYGDGPNIDEFFLLSEELGIADSIKLPGAVDKVPERLTLHDIAFHPSKGEAMSLALLEYMSAGLPLLVSSNESVSSFLTNDEDSIVYTEDDIDDCVDNLIALLRDTDLRRRLGQSARQLVSEKYTRDKMLSNFSHTIRKVIS